MAKRKKDIDRFLAIYPKSQRCRALKELKKANAEYVEATKGIPDLHRGALADRRILKSYNC